MEGVGSRLGRVSSRYGPTTTVFNGPVRKWRKKWVRVFSSPTLSSSTTHSQSGVHKLLLCRWTPVPTISPPPATDSDAVPEEPPRRKFRYTPVSVETISVVEEQKNAVMKKVEDGEGKRRVGLAAMIEKVQEKPNIDLIFGEETTMISAKKLLSLNDPNESDLDLGLCLNGKTGNLGSVG